MKHCLRIFFLLFLWVNVPHFLNAQQCTFTWAKIAVNNDQSGNAKAVTTDPDDNLLVTGSFGATIDLDGTNLVSSGGDDIVIAKYSPGGRLIWAKRFGSVDADAGAGIATDNGGNVYVTGFFNASVNFGNGNNLTSAGDDDIFVMKLDPNGNTLWARRYGSTGSDQGTDLAVTPEGGAIFVSGLFQGTVAFEENRVSVGNSDFFLMGLSDQGAASWSVTGGGPGYDDARSVALDPVGNVYITGQFRSSLTIDIDGSPVTVNSQGNADIFLAKFNGQGGPTWLRSAGGASDDYGYSIVGDPGDNIYVCGIIQSLSVRLNGGQVIGSQPTDGNQSFVMRFQSEGNFRWLRLAERTSQTFNDAKAITTNALGDIYVAGGFLSNIKWGNLTANAVGSNSDMYLTKLDSLNNILFLKKLGQDRFETAEAITADSEGSIYIGGQAQDVLTNCSRFTGGTIPNFFAIKHECNIAPVVITPQITAVTAPGGSDGRITLNVTGGVSEYRYRLGLNGVFQSSNIFSNLAVGTYKVYVQGAGGCIDSSQVVVVLNSTCTPPDITEFPSDVTNVSFSQRWRTVPGSIGYLARYRLAGQSTWSDTVRINAPDTVFTLAPANAGATYEVQVFSICPTDTSDGSDLLQVITEAGCFVTQLNVSDIGTTTATAVFVNGTTGSKLTLRQLSGPTTTFNNVITVPFPLTDLSPNTNYELCIVPFNCPDSTQCIPFKTADPNATCARVTNLRTSNITASSVRAAWNAGQNITRYEVAIRPASSQTYSPIINVTPPKIDTLFAGLNANTDYVIRIRAVCTNGINSAFDSVTVKTATCIKPEISAVITGQGISVTWTAVPGVPAYQPEFKIAGSPGAFTVLPTVSVPNALVTPVNRNTNYLIRVRSLCSGTSSSVYDSVTITVPGCLPPDVFSELTPTGTQVKWRRVLGAVSYELQFKRKTASSWSPVEVLNDTLKNYTFLLADTAYQFRVRTVCVAGSEFSAYDTLEFQNAGCGTPQNLRVCGNGPALITWKPAPNSLGYYLSYRKIGSSVWTFARVNDTVNTIDNRNNTVPYEVRVQSLCNGLILSAFSLTDTSETCNDLCATPSNVAVPELTITTRQAVVSWNAVPGARFYEIRYKTTFSNNWLTTTSSGTSVTVGGLLTNTIYEVQVRTVCITDQNSAFSTTVTFRTANPGCALPTGLQVTNITANSATLRWTAPAGVNFFNIQYRVKGSNAPYTVLTGVQGTSRDLTGLQPGVTYEFSVQSSCVTGTSVYVSPNVEFTTVPICNPPTNVTVTGIGTNRATVSWTAASGALSYRVRIIRRETGAAFTVVVNAPGRSVNLINLLADTDYRMIITTVCAGNNVSIPTDTVSFRTLQLCRVPENISVINITSEAAAVQWNAVQGAVGYEVSYKRRDEISYTVLPVTSELGQPLSGLRNSTLYDIRVRTVCTAGSNFSLYVSDSFKTVRSGCQAPINLRAEAFALDEIRLTWDGSENAVRYEVQFRQRGNANFNTRTVLRPSDTLKPVSPAFTYEIRVRAICSDDRITEYTPVLTFNTQTANECRPPVSFRVTPADTSANVTWSAVSGAGAFQIAFRKIGAADWSTRVVTPGTATAFRLTGLSPSTDYEIKIQSLCSNEGSLFTLVQKFKTTAVPVLVCDAPQNLTAVTDFFTATLKWGRVSRAQKYLVLWRKVGESSFIPVETTADTLFLDDLTPNSVYEFRVRSICGVGDSSVLSSVRAFSTPALPLCPKPTITSAVARSRSTIFVTWNRVNEAVGYELAWKRINDPDWITLRFNSRDSLSKLLTGLAANENYQIKIQTLCQNNVSDYIEPQIVRTLETDPCAVPVTGSVSTGSDRVTVNWTTVPGAIGYVVAYRVQGQQDWSTRVIQGGNNASALISNLQPATFYEWMIQTLCNNAPSEFSSVNLFRTQAAGAVTCPPPAGLSVSSITRNSAILTWPRVNQAVSYRISFRRNNQSLFTSVSVPASQLTFRLFGLTTSTGYVVRIQTVCTGAISSPIQSTFTTLALAEEGPITENDPLKPVLYPNPNKGTFQIEFNEPLKVSVYDLTGREIYRTDLHETGEIQLPEGTAAGLYQVKLTSETIQTTVKMWVE